MIGPQKIRWGILGTGRIAGVFAKALASSNTGIPAAVGSRKRDTAEAFADALQIPRRHASYEALLDDPEIDALYIATPHPFHAEWAIRGAEAGKHLLVEKPIALNYAQAMAVVEAARHHDVFLMEGFMFRLHPQIAKLRELLNQKAIGDLRLIRASYGFKAAFHPESRLFSNPLGGGSILDLGCYCVSLARLAAGAARQADFVEPLEVLGAGLVGFTRVDELAVTTLRFPGDICAQLSCSIGLAQENDVLLYGSEGRIRLPNPWSPDADPRRVLLYRDGKKEPQEILLTTDRSLFTIEADSVAAFLPARQSPIMTWNDTLGNMQALDRWRRAIGMDYAAETPEGMTRPIHGRPLKIRKGAYMPRRRLPGLRKEASQIILGAMCLNEAPLAFILYDDFFERGGNAFDTAYVYGGGKSERILGQWLAQRGIRDQVVLITKGAHSPFCTPEWLTRQLVESLDRLQTECVDIYMLHRDNVEVPVGAFIETLNELQRAGRIGIFGASNWNLTRVDAANAYARERNLNGFSVISNQFSLARMVEPVWAGSVSAFEPKSREWHTRSGIPLLPWSSQAAGFFVRGDPAKRNDPKLVSGWYSEDNFQRLDRARKLAEKRGVQPVQIALAYALNQPFSCFPMIGPLNLSELAASCDAVFIRLTPREMAWLNLEADTP